jgi:hypothetical protein
MKRLLICLAVGLACITGAAFAGSAESIEGNYLEVRSCDVYTAACHANAEVGLLGQEATMAWQVTRGAYNGVDISGLAVVAAIRANGTLTDTKSDAFTGKGIIIVDINASPAQRDALVALAREHAGSLLSEVVRVESAPIEMTVGEAHGVAQLKAGDAAAIETRCLVNGDKHCGNDQAYYPPLTEVSDAMAAYTVRDMFSLSGLGVKWDDTDRRSAYIAKFQG